MSPRMVYRALRPVGLTDEQIQAAGAAIAKISKQFGGVCPPAEYVERARPIDSPTHHTVPWDDYELAEQGRREVAANLIQVIVLDKPDSGTFTNVSVVTMVDDQITRGYVAVDHVRDRPEWRGQVERELLARIRGDCANHRWLPVAQQLMEYIDGLRSSQRADVAAD